MKEIEVFGMMVEEKAYEHMMQKIEGLWVEEEQEDWEDFEEFAEIKLHHMIYEEV